MQHKDYYKILDVDRRATPREIQSAFRRLARKYHPDVNPNDPQAEERFKEINAAYEVLGDPEERLKYDQQVEAIQSRQQAGYERQARTDWQQRRQTKVRKPRYARRSKPRTVLSVLWTLLIVLLAVWRIIDLPEGLWIFGLSVGNHGRITQRALVRTSRDIESMEFLVSEGDDVVLKYSVDVDEGSAFLFLQEIRGWLIFSEVDTVWYTRVKESDEGEVRITAPARARYEVNIHLSKFKGVADVQWSTERAGEHNSE